MKRFSFIYKVACLGNAKKIVFLFVASVMPMLASAQQYVRVWSGGVSTQVMMADVEQMPVANGVVTIAGQEWSVASIDSITIGARVHVVYSGDEAAVEIPDLVRGVTANVSGADVELTNTLVGDELEVVLSGVSQTGSFTYYGQYKTTFILNGLNLKSDKTAAMNIQCGKRIDMELMPGTDNMLEDCTGGTQKAALYCRGHLELSGAGTLTVKGNSAHAISTNEYLEVKKSVVALTVNGAEKDGIHVGQYYQQNGSTVTILGNKGDALQVEIVTNDDGTPDDTKELNGQCIIKGGSLTAQATSDDCDALKVDGDITISGGTLTLTATGAGARCIKTDANLTVNEATDATVISLYASGDKFVDALGDSSRSRLGKVDGDMLFDAGQMKGSYEGKAKGMKVVGTLTWNKTGGATYTGMGWEAGRIVTK